MISSAVDPDMIDLLMQLKAASCMNSRSCLLLVASIKNNGQAIKKTLEVEVGERRAIPRNG